jgi:hypothetical protein
LLLWGTFFKTDFPWNFLRKFALKSYEKSNPGDEKRVNVHHPRVVLYCSKTYFIDRQSNLIEEDGVRDARDEGPQLGLRERPHRLAAVPASVTGNVFEKNNQNVFKK